MARITNGVDKSLLRPFPPSSLLADSQFWPRKMWQSTALLLSQRAERQWQKSPRSSVGWGKEEGGRGGEGGRQGRNHGQKETVSKWVSPGIWKMTRAGSLADSARHVQSSPRTGVFFSAPWQQVIIRVGVCCLKFIYIYFWGSWKLVLYIYRDFRYIYRWNINLS